MLVSLRVQRVNTVIKHEVSFISSKGKRPSPIPFLYPLVSFL